MLSSYRIRITRSIALMCSVGMLVAGGAQAQTTPSDRIDTRFKTADVNGDGKLTLDEAKASKTGMPRVAKNFSAIDVDKKGYVTLEQIKSGASAK